MAEYKQMNIFGELEDIDMEIKGKRAKTFRSFLFCPALTSIYKGCTFVAVNAKITYENGANVNTCFVTNLAGDLIAMTAPDLSKSLNVENKRLVKQGKKDVSKLAFPPRVLRAFDLQRLARCGVHYEVRASEGAVRSKVCDYDTFGCSVLLSDEATKKRIKAMEDARRVKFEEIRAEETTLQLSQTDWDIINSLNKNTKHD